MLDQLNQPSDGEGYAPAQDTGADDGGTQQTQQDLAETLAAYGVPNDVLEQVKGATLRQGDYTRKTQELADYRRALELQQQQINQIATWALQQSQAAQGSGEQAMSNFDRVWQEFTKEGNEEQAKPIKALFDAKEADIAARMRQTELQLAEYKAKEAFQQEYETSVKPMFGNHLDAVWQEAQQISMRELMQGRVVSPLAVISQLAPDKLLEAAKKAATTQQTGLPPEGMVNLRHEQPIVGGNAQTKGDPSSTENILREVQAMMRGRLSA